jgi:hypothetical protein
MAEERFWDDAFTRAAQSDAGADRFAVADDLNRGRRQLRRNRTLAGAAAGLALAGVVGTTMVLSVPASSSGGAPAADPVVDSATALPLPVAPTMTLEPSPEPTSPTATVKTHVPGYGESRAWRNELFAITASVLDPERRHLNYDTQSRQSGSDGKGGIHLGIQMGWTVAGQSGEGVVAVMLSTETGPDAPGCWEYPVDGCHPERTGSGVRYEVGHGEGGVFVLIHEQPDGERVLVYVNPLFGNNAVTPVTGMDVTEADVLRLVQDERLNLPE